MNKLLKPLLAALLLAASSLGHATLVPASWSETRDFNLPVPPTRTFTHDLTTVGFQPFNDVILTFDLIVDLYDDGDRRREAALIDIPGIFGDRRYYNLEGEEGSGLSLLALLELNTSGMLTVTIESIRPGIFTPRGDFILGSSTLTAYGLTRVPAPGALALLGLGLAAGGLLRRRRSI